MGTKRKKYSASKLFSTREANYDGYKMLAAKIIEMAIRQWRQFGYMEEYPAAFRGKRARKRLTQTHYSAWTDGRMLGFKGPKEEMLCFFYGDWFETLCDMIDCNPSTIRRKIGVGV